MRAAAIVSGIGPLDAPGATRGMGSRNRMGFWVGGWAPWWYWRFLNWLFFRKVHLHPENLFPDDQSGSVLADQQVLQNSEVLDLCRASVSEGMRQGTTGHAWEGRLLSRQWGFDLGEITIPMQIWHGELDVDTPVHMGRAMARSIPNCTVTILPEAGHLLIFQHWGAVLRSLLSSHLS